MFVGKVNDFFILDCFSNRREIDFSKAMLSLYLHIILFTMIQNLQNIFPKNKNFSDSDIFILVQATSPFVVSADFDNAISQLKKEKADSLLSCVRVKKFFWEENGKPINYQYTQRPRRQDFNGVLMENGAFYINSIANIKKI